MTETIAEHLSAVDAVLGARGFDATARAGVLADLAGHIDALRALGHPDDRIVAMLDPPDDYGALVEPFASPAAEPARRSGRPVLDRLSLGLSIGGLLGGVAIGVIASALNRDGAHAGFVLFFGCQLAAIAVGLVGWRSTLARAGCVAGAVLVGVSLLL